MTHQSIDGEVVVINMTTGVYYSLLGVSARVWERIAAGISVPDVVAEVRAQYGEDAAASVEQFIAQLAAEQLLVEGEQPVTGTPQEPLPDVFAAPVLESFNDMQELLLLDPIHEVDQYGWPNKPAE